MANIPTPNMSRLFQTAGSQQQQQGTGYTNLNRLIDTNKNNQLGQKVAGDIGTQLGGVQTQLAQQQEKFNKQAEENRLDTDTNKAEREAVLGRFTSPSTAGTVSDEDVNKFQKFRTGEYTGPQNLGDTSAISQAASGLAQQTSNFSPSGTQELLRRSVGGDRYSQGQQRLDTLLMDRSSLTPIQRQSQGLGQEINRANLSAQGKAQLLKNQAQQFGTETTEALNKGLTGIDTSVQGQLTAAQEAEKARQANIQAIQNFAANKTPKLDASGNPVKDQYGNVVYDTSVNTRGTTDTAGQLDTLRQQLVKAGAQPEEIQQILGTQENFGKTYGSYQPKLQELSGAIGSANKLAEQGDVSGLKSMASKYLSPDQYVQAMAAQRAGNTRSAGDGGAGALAGYINNVLSGKANAATAERNQILTSTGGIGGKALIGGQQEALYKNLAAALANSPQAQNLTEQGVASDAQRANYEALNKLLGATGSKYSTTADKYQAGNLLLNPEQIKRSLGY